MSSVNVARVALLKARPPVWLLLWTRALIELQGETLDVVYFLERPEKWANEYAAWCAAGHPAGPGEPGWERFAEDVEGWREALDVLIFHRFPTRAAAESFVERIGKAHPELAAGIYDAAAQAQAADPFPWALEPPIVHVDRTEPEGGDQELESALGLRWPLRRDVIAQ